MAVYATNTTRRFYHAHWCRLARHIGLDIQRYAAFNGEDMIGLKLPREDFTAEQLFTKMNTLNKISQTVENKVPMRVYLFGARRYRFVLFEQFISVTEVSNEDV